MAQSTQFTSGPSGAKHDLRETATRQFDKVADQVEGAVKSVTERGRDVGHDVQEVAGNIKTAVDTSVKDQPMATLAVAAVVGFVLGALWKT